MVKVARHGRQRAVALVLSIVAVLAIHQVSSRSVYAQPPQRIDVLIGFRNTPGPNEQAIVRAFGGTINYSYTAVPAIAASIPETALQGLQRNPNVTVVEPDAEVFALDAYTDELAATWGVNRVAGGKTATAGTPIRVAVIDTGINCNHADLKRNGVTICASGWDYINNDNDASDDNGHGTHVAGTIAATKNGSGVVGVAPGVALYPLKALKADGTGSFSAVMAALNWAMSHGIQITSNSYGSTSDPGSMVKMMFDKSSLTMVHVVAAGNTGNCTGTSDSVNYPARYSSVIAVAAVDSNNARACFSSTGSKIELSAPGVSIKSTVITKVSTTGYATWSGTSMATPHVAGVAALLMSAGVTSPSQVRSIMQKTATDLGTAGRDIKYGYGLVNAAAALASIGK